jgi:hypothetical protein
MSIKNHLGNLTPTTDQLNAIQKLDEFLLNDTSIFILKGYAGTGKTTLISSLIKEVSQLGKEFSVMAPTGRAAKILRDKTGHGYTIHKSIYNFHSLELINHESEDEAEHNFHYHFPINKIDSTIQQILIVDESSMISNVESKNELFTFGTNYLLNDLLTYSSINTTKNKLIFIGDSAQLPPVNDNKSLALDFNYFLGLGLSVQVAELKEIKRQSDNLILKNATSIRNLIKTENRSNLTFDYDTESFIKTNTEDVVQNFTSLFTKPEIGDGIIIAYSNQQCYQYNQSIRKLLFPDQRDVVSGDLLLLNNNNYHTYGVELFNGDILKVIDVDNNTIVQSAPVWCSDNGIKIRKEIKIEFRKITIRLTNHPEDIACLIIDSHLHSIDRELSFNEMRALYINFILRFNDEQKNRIERNLQTFKVGSEEFKDALKNDPFFNALRVKFGYAITCHKSQGGEWKKVFVDYFGRVSLKTIPLKWCYTATTRGIESLYAINAPNFGSFTKLKFASVGRIGTLPNDALYLENITISPFHNENQHKAKSLKYWAILEQIENSSFRIIDIESRDFLERYTMEYENLVFKIEASHKGSGHFINKFKVLSHQGIEYQIINEIEDIFNSINYRSLKPNYNPSKLFLERLFSEIQFLCDDLNIKITNIIEAKNYVNYYFVTDSPCSYIQFYFNDKDVLTTAMPKTFECISDNKLNLLIEKITTHVI